MTRPPDLSYFSNLYRIYVILEQARHEEPVLARLALPTTTTGRQHE
jgi:hypothetical protein